MGVLIATDFDGGDKRTSASVSFELESDKMKVVGANIEGDGGLELDHIEVDGICYINKGAYAYVRENLEKQGKTVKELKKWVKLYEFLNHLGFYDTPLAEPINCRYQPRAYDHWASEVDGFQEDIDDELILLEKLGLSEKDLQKAK